MLFKIASTPEIACKTKEVNKLFNKQKFRLRTYCRTESPLIEQQYETCPNKRVVLLKKIKKAYYERKLADKLDDPKRFFEEFSSL